MLVACVDELGELAHARPDAASQLVAGRVPRRLQTLGHRARPGSAGLQYNLSNRACGLERTDRLGIVGWMNVRNFRFQHPTPNKSANRPPLDVLCWMLDVGCFAPFFAISLGFLLLVSSSSAATNFFPIMPWNHAPNDPA